MLPSHLQNDSENPINITLEVTLGRLLLSFLKIGSIGFGGGMAVIALMETEFVRKRKVIRLEEFLHGVALGQVLGAFAVNLSVFIGYRLFRAPGALLSAAVFLAPSVILVIFLSELYFRFHAIPALRGTIDGVSPVVIALIVNAAWAIGRKELRTWATLFIAFAAFLAGIGQINTLWVLLCAGMAGFLLPVESKDSPQSPQTAASAKAQTGIELPFVLPISLPLPAIASTFFKVGLMFVGGGFVLIPLLHDQLVTQLGWLKPQEFLDGLAISSLTPGPVAVLATFAGYHLAGVSGALLATVALFTPGILLMLAFSQQYHRFSGDMRVRRFLSGVNPAVAGLILSAAPLLGRTALVTWRGYAMLALSFALLVMLRWPPVAALAVGAVAGYFGLLP